MKVILVLDLLKGIPCCQLDRRLVRLIERMFQNSGFFTEKGGRDSLGRPGSRELVHLVIFHLGSSQGSLGVASKLNETKGVQ